MPADSMWTRQQPSGRSTTSTASASLVPPIPGTLLSRPKESPAPRKTFPQKAPELACRPCRRTCSSPCSTTVTKVPRRLPAFACTASSPPPPVSVSSSSLSPLSSVADPTPRALILTPWSQTEPEPPYRSTHRITRSPSPSVQTARSIRAPPAPIRSTDASSLARTTTTTSHLLHWIRPATLPFSLPARPSPRAAALRLHPEQPQRQQTMQAALSQLQRRRPATPLYPSLLDFPRNLALPIRSPDVPTCFCATAMQLHSRKAASPSRQECRRLNT